MEPGISSHPTSSPLRTSTAPPHHMNCAQHVLLTSSMFLFMLALARYFSTSSVGFAISAIVLVYFTAMIHLELLRQRRRGNLDQVTRPLMMLATGITFISVSTAAFVFQPDRQDLLYIVVFIFLCAALAIRLENRIMGPEDAKPKDASDLV